jgi:hypothetical protein
VNQQLGIRKTAKQIGLMIPPECWAARANKLIT